MKLLTALIVDTAATRIQQTIARLRTRKPQPWQCRHQWQLCPIVVTGQPGRYCPRCTALESRFYGQPILHPESMSILLPQGMENTLAALDEALWPGEAV